jgi:HSP20 family protein
MGDQERDPFAELMSMRQMLDRRLEETFSRPRRTDSGRSGPRPVLIDLLETNEEFVVRASLPGVGPGDVKVSVADNRLTISVDVKDKAASQERSAYRGRLRGAFERVVELSRPVKGDQIGVRVADGTLVVTIPKAV